MYSNVCIGEGNGTPLRYSCLENPMDGGAWWAAVHGVAKSRARLSDFTFTFHFHALEKEMATHSSVLAWRIPETQEPSRLPSMGSHRVGHKWSELAVKFLTLILYLSQTRLSQRSTSKISILSIRVSPPTFTQMPITWKDQRFQQFEPILQSFQRQACLHLGRPS